MDEKELLFSDKHIWMEINGDNAKIGLTSYAQEQLGAIMFVNLPDEGEQINRNVAFGDVESVKTVSDLISPISGTILEINEKLIDEPELINESPYENWLVKLEVEDDIPALMTFDEYQKFLEE